MQCQEPISKMILQLRTVWSYQNGGNPDIYTYTRIAKKQFEASSSTMLVLEQEGCLAILCAPTSDLARWRFTSSIHLCIASGRPGGDVINTQLTSLLIHARLYDEWASSSLTGKHTGWWHRLTNTSTMSVQQNHCLCSVEWLLNWDNQTLNNQFRHVS